MRNRCSRGSGTAAAGSLLWPALEKLQLDLKAQGALGVAGVQRGQCSAIVPQGFAGLA